MHGSRVCYNHGGPTPKGLASPQTKSGRWSKDLPTRLAARYEEAVRDKDLLSLRSEIAVIDARLSELLGMIDTGEAGSLWIGLREAALDVTNASNEAKRKQAWGRVLALIERGAQDWLTWRDIIGCIHSRQKLVMDEHKRMKELDQMIQVDSLILIIGLIEKELRSHVDRDTLAAVSRAIRPAVLGLVAGQA